MKPFNVLDRHLSIRRHHLLEASAGTGKTFSIQNLFCRLLIEPPNDFNDTLISEILVVTFTRAATRDLKHRIRQNLTQMLHLLTLHQRDQRCDNLPPPDFLSFYLEQGKSAILKACRRLKRALLAFDQAQIFTIHSFCSRMLLQYALESDFGLNALNGEKSIPANQINEVIKNYFRTEVHRHHYTVGQLDIILKKDPDHKILARLINSPIDIAPSLSLDDLFHKFQTTMHDLKNRFNLHHIDMMDDFSALQKIHLKYSTTKTIQDIFKVADRFAKLFDKDQWTHRDFDLIISDEIVWVKAFDSLLLKKNQILPSLHYPGLTLAIANELLPIVEQGGTFSHLIARMAHDCKKLYRRYLEEEETLGPDDILRKMKEALKNPHFVEKVRQTYSTAIIDEFQDTDPLQWEIFYTLFSTNPLEWDGTLYLVGDPKQSIYSFRQADIYTYLDAKNKIGEEHQFSLSVNYRSTPQLIDTLNFLFSQEICPNLFTLPYVNQILPYQPVSAALEQKQFSSPKSAVHFIIADAQQVSKKKPTLAYLEEKIYFPFIANEINQLKSQESYTDKQFAILVKDHFQARRIGQFLTENGFSINLQKGRSLADSPVLKALISLLQGVLKPRHRGLVRAALLTPLLRWTLEQIEQHPTMEYPINLMTRWRAILLSEGFLSFIQAVMDSPCQKEEMTFRDQLLSSKEGMELYRDLQQLINLIADHHYDEWNLSEEIIPFLDRLKQWKEEEDPRVNQISDPEANGIEIITLHYSKGLEFDVVFALGLINASEIREELIPTLSEGKLIQQVIPTSSQAYISYCEERDSEKIRQLYVAMTRAKDLLYIPVIIGLPKNSLKVGGASPIDLFLARLCQSSANYEHLYQRIKQGFDETLVKFLDVAATSHSISYSIHNEIDITSEKIDIDNESELLVHPKTITLSYQPLYISSFSSLHQQQKERVAETAETSIPQRDDFSNEKSVHTLPASQQTGLLTHLILENIPFSSFQHMPFRKIAYNLIAPYLINTPLQEWLDPMAQLIHQALTTPLHPLSHPFALSEISDTSLYREIDFLYTMKPGLLNIDYPIDIGLLKGVIDLVFIHQGIYYIVDWKTNWLGPDRSYYQYSNLQAAMDEHDYHLQATIYVEALKRYIALIDSRPFKECFGGVFYLFVRGMHPGEQSGIYHFF